MVTTQERRRSERLALRWPVCIWHPGVGRFVTAATREVGRTGMSVTVPLSVPFSGGQVVEVRFPQDLPSAMLANVKPVNARIAHVYKEEAIIDGEQVVGLCFLEEMAAV